MRLVKEAIENSGHKVNGAIIRSRYLADGLQTMVLESPSHALGCEIHVSPVPLMMGDLR